MTKTIKTKLIRQRARFRICDFVKRLFFQTIPRSWRWHYPNVVCTCVCTSWGCHCAAKPQLTRLGTILKGIYASLFFAWEMPEVLVLPRIDAPWPKLDAKQLIEVQPMM